MNKNNLWKLEFYPSKIINTNIITEILSNFYSSKLTNNKLMLYMIKIRCSEDGMDTHPLSNIIISRGSHANFKSAILSIEEELANFYNRYLSLECYGLEVHYRELSPNEPIGIQGEKVSRNIKDKYKEFIDSESYSPLGENKIPLEEKQSDYNLWEGLLLILKIILESFYN